MLISPLICALRQIQWLDPWRAASNVNRGRAARAARRGIAGRMWPARRRLVSPVVRHLKFKVSTNTYN